MVAVAVGEDQDLMGASRERRCIATGEVLPEARLVRFVLDSEGNVVPDIEVKLPGRGIWISADRRMIENAAKRNLFAKAAGGPRRRALIWCPARRQQSRNGSCPMWGWRGVPAT